MPRSPSPSPLWTLIAIDAAAIAGILLVNVTVREVPAWLTGAEIVVIGGMGAACCTFWWRLIGKPLEKGSASGTPFASGDLEALRKENADNLQVLQQDLHGLGQALMKRLAAQSRPETEHFDAIAGTITDLAISLAESRESLAAVAADISETKSVIFEIQAQVDQQADALHAFEKALGHTREVPGESSDAGDGAAPGSLGKALLSGGSGSAVARLIGNGFSFKAAETLPAPDEVVPAEGEAGHGDEVPPLATTDIEGAYDSEGEEIPGQDFSVDPVTEEEWSAAGEPADTLAPAAELVVPEPLVRDEAALIEAEESEEEEDWLTAGLEEEELAIDEAEPAALQPDLLALDGDLESPRKPRRPGRHDTALIAHVMIGIGNKPYLRGFGPGLSYDKGVPMEYVDVGRWQWVCPESGSPVTVTLWKNDEIPAEGDAVSVPSGMTLEIHPQFSH